jgi:uncharacterized protein
MISVIIPTYNEEKTIKNTIEVLKKNSNCKNYEVIVVDSSEDNTIENIPKNVKVLRCEKGRAKQMNLGARKAKGDIFAFLHADVLVPKNWDLLIEDEIKYNDYGVFLKEFDSKGIFIQILRIYSVIMTLVFHAIRGDHFLFLRKKVFEEFKGYSDISLMEDLDISKKLKKYKFGIVKERIIVSSRRLEKFGYLKVLMIWIKLQFLYYTGADPNKLKRYYSDDK